MSQSAETGGSSRPSKTNPADRQNRQYGPSLGASLSERLTERDGVSLRPEAVEETMYGTDALSWRETTWRWRDYIRESRETSQVFMNEETGEVVKGSSVNRFLPEYADKQYAKLKDLERGVRKEYGKRLHTAMLSLTASRTTDDGEAVPPVDHLDDLLDSTEAVMRALRRVMEGRRSERLIILEPHKSGYLHIHVAVFVDGLITAEMFRPVVEAHLRNCDRAGREAHNIEDDSTISVKHVGADRSEDTIENLGTYLAEYLGTYGDDPLDAEDHVQAANAVLWATGRRRWRPSNGAQEYMRTEQSDEETPWEFVGIEDGTGELHRVVGGGGVSRRTETWTAVDGPPPEQ